MKTTYAEVQSMLDNKQINTTEAMRLVAEIYENECRIERLRKIMKKETAAKKWWQVWK